MVSHLTTAYREAAQQLSNGGLSNRCLAHSKRSKVYVLFGSQFLLIGFKSYEDTLGVSLPPHVVDPDGVAIYRERDVEQCAWICLDAVGFCFC